MSVLLHDCSVVHTVPRITKHSSRSIIQVTNGIELWRRNIYLSVQTKNRDWSSGWELQNSSIFANRDSCAKAAWNGKTLVRVPFLSSRFNTFSTFLQVSICTKQMPTQIKNGNYKRCKGGTKWHSQCTLCPITLLQKIIVFVTVLPSTSRTRADFLLENAVSGLFSTPSSPLQSTRTW